MKNFALVFVAALSLAAVGCKKKGVDCEKALNHSMELSKDSMSKMGNDATMMQKMKDLGLQHCKDDKWSGDVLKCMVDAKTMGDSQACYGKLTQDQQDKMNKAAMELMMPKGDAVGSNAGAGSAAAGSDTGSAAAAGSDTGSAAAGSAAAGSAAAGSAAAGSAAAPK